MSLARERFESYLRFRSKIEKLRNILLNHYMFSSLKKDQLN